MTYHPQSDLGLMQTSIDSRECPACESPKLGGKVLCALCFNDISASLQNALKFRRGEQLLSARDEALVELRQLGVRPMEDNP